MRLFGKSLRENLRNGAAKVYAAGGEQFVSGGRAVCVVLSRRMWTDLPVDFRSTYSLKSSYEELENVKYQS